MTLCQLNFSISREDKDILKRAAKQNKQTLSAFMRDTAHAEAERQREERIRTFNRGFHSDE